MAAGFTEEWVAELSPARLKHYYRELIQNRASRQREDLNIQVSAAAVIADGGKMAKNMDSALSDAAGHSTVRGTPGSDEGERKKSKAEASEVQRSFDETAHLWKRK